MNPKVSVIMCTYNDSQYIGEAIKSVLASSFTDFEFIICDDASTDDTPEIIKSFKDKRIKYIRNETNLRPAASRNRCFHEAKGDYIMQLDSDDIALPNRIQLQVDYLDNFPDVPFCGGWARVIDENGEHLRDFFHSENVTLKDIFVSDSYINPAVMFRREKILHVDGYTTGFGRSEDLDLWLKLYASGIEGKNIQDYLIEYRETKAGLYKSKFKHRVEAYKILRHWKKKLRLGFKYNVYAFRQIILGLAPKWFVIRIKRRKAKKFKKGV